VKLVYTQNSTHEITTTFERTKPPQGGLAVPIEMDIPVNKLALLAPYIGLASTIVAVTVATVIYVKRVKCRKEKQ